MLFPYGARFANHMAVSDSPIDWNFWRWRQTLEAYVIDVRGQFDLQNVDDRALLDSVTVAGTGFQTHDRGLPESRHKNGGQGAGYGRHGGVAVPISFPAHRVVLRC
jgi:hypothetical protein